MAVNQYVILDGKTKKVNKKYAVIDGKTRKIKKEYVVIDGKTRLCWSGFEPKFVGLARNNCTLYSTDGIAWVKNTSLALDLDNTNFRHTIAFGNETFVFIAKSGTVGYSADGITWTTQTLSLSGYTLTNGSISFCNGNFVVLITAGTKTAVYKSTDGKTWSYIGLITPYSYYALSNCARGNIVYATYNGNKYYIIGLHNYTNDNTSGLWYSADLLNWTRISGEGMSNYYDSFEINGVYYGVVANSNEKISIFKFDSTSKNILSCCVIGDSSYTYCRGVIYNHDIGEIAVVASDGGNVNRLYITNGKTSSFLQKAYSIPMLNSSLSSIDGICYGAGKYVAFYRTGSSSSASVCISYSNDGITWTTATLFTYNTAQIRTESLCYAN